MVCPSWCLLTRPASRPAPGREQSLRVADNPPSWHLLLQPTSVDNPVIAHVREGFRALLDALVSISEQLDDDLDRQDQDPLTPLSSASRSVEHASVLWTTKFSDQWSRTSDREPAIRTPPALDDPISWLSSMSGPPASVKVGQVLGVLRRAISPANWDPKDVPEGPAAALREMVRSELGIVVTAPALWDWSRPSVRTMVTDAATACNRLSGQMGARSLEQLKVLGLWVDSCARLVSDCRQAAMEYVANPGPDREHRIDEALSVPVDEQPSWKEMSEDDYGTTRFSMSWMGGTFYNVWAEKGLFDTTEAARTALHSIVPKEGSSPPATEEVQESLDLLGRLCTRAKFGKSQVEARIFRTEKAWGRLEESSTAMRRAL